MIIITTGSRPFHPPGIPFDDPDVLDSDAAALLDRPLRSLVVVGGGAVGCEFASIFTALGADVMLVDSGPRLLPVHGRRDRRRAGRDVSRHGHARRAGRRARAAPRGPPRGCEVELANGETLRAREGDLRHRPGRATPRASGSKRRAWRPTSAAASSSTSTTGRPSTGIYAAGDVIGPPALASVSMEQARDRRVLGVRHPAEARRRLAAAVRRLLGARGRDGRPHRGGRRGAGHRLRGRAGAASRPTPGPPSPARPRAW